MTIVAHVPNLFDRSRFAGQVVFVDDPDDLPTDDAPELVIVDLDRCDAPAAYVGRGARLIGFGPHVDTEAHDAALAAGYDEVLPRSVFFRRIDNLLAEVGGR